MKERIKQSLASVLIVPALLFAGAVVVGVSPQNASAAVSDGISGGANSAKTDDQSADIEVTFKEITNILLYIIGAISVVMIVIGGIRYTISNGDSSAITGAKNTILYAVIGLVVAVLAYAIVNFVIGGLVA